MAIANARLSPARLSFLCQYLQGTVVLKHYISRHARRWHTQFFGYKRSCFLILTGGLLLDSVQLKSDRVRSWIQSSSQTGPSSVFKLDPVLFLSWTQSNSHPVTTNNSWRTLDWGKNWTRKPQGMGIADWFQTKWRTVAVTNTSQHGVWRLILDKWGLAD